MTALRAAAALTLLLACGLVLAGDALVLTQGSSRVLTFPGMRRVAVIDPTVADVIVASRTELIVFGKQPGRTRLYVWDRAGRHEYLVTVKPVPAARLAVGKLAAVLPPGVTVRVLGDDAVLMRGAFASQQEADKFRKIARELVGQAKLVDLTFVQTAEPSPAAQVARQIAQLYGPRVQCVVWGRDAVLVRGHMDKQTEDELTKLSAALQDQVRIIVAPAKRTERGLDLDLVAKALGEGFRVWTIAPDTVVIEGTARDKQSFDRVQKLAQGLSGKLNVVNMVTLEEQAPDLSRYVDAIRRVAGEGVQVRQLTPWCLSIEGQVSSKEQLERIKALLGVLPQNVRVLNLVSVVEPTKRQIRIKVRVVDINRDALKKYGTDWGQIVISSTGQPSFADQPWLVRVEGGVDNVFDIGAQLHALQQRNLARILAEPVLAVNDGEQATVVVGGEIPIPVAQPGSTGFLSITVEYKTYGVQLMVKPKIVRDGLVEVNLQPEVSTIDYSAGVTIGGLTIPGLRTRRTSSTVTVRSGDTLIIAGLIKHDQATLVKKLPVLGDLPIIGSLFRRREFQRGESELAVFLTPEIMPPLQPRGGGRPGP